jgi:hypothetical protein
MGMDRKEFIGAAVLPTLLLLACFQELPVVRWCAIVFFGACVWFFGFFQTLGFALGIWFSSFFWFVVFELIAVLGILMISYLPQLVFISLLSAAIWLPFKWGVIGLLGSACVVLCFVWMCAKGLENQYSVVERQKKKMRERRQRRNQRYRKLRATRKTQTQKD